MTLTFNFRCLSKDNEKIFNRAGRPFLSKKFKDFAKIVSDTAKAQLPQDFKMFDGDLAVVLNFTFTNRVHCDASNLPKGILDALNKVIWKDDRQIKHLSIDVNYDEVDSFTIDVLEIPWKLKEPKHEETKTGQSDRVKFIGPIGLQKLP